MNEQAAAMAIESVKVRIARQMRETHAASQPSAKFFLYGKICSERARELQRRTVRRTA